MGISRYEKIIKIITAPDLQNLESKINAEIEKQKTEHKVLLASNLQFKKIDNDFIVILTFSIQRDED